MAARRLESPHPAAPTGSEPESESRISRIADADVPADVDPNHHLWRNGRLWWIAFTVHRGNLQERVRFSLGTADVERARRERDRIFALYETAADCRISIRLRPRRAARPSASSPEPRRAASAVR